MEYNEENNVYEYRGIKARVLNRPVSYVFGDTLNSDDIFYRRELGIQYSRIEAILDTGKMYCEAGSFNASQGPIKFAPMDLSVGGLTSGYINQKRGSEFFKSTLTGTGKVWLADTSSYILVVTLKQDKITLEKGIFYAGIGDLKFTVSSDVRMSNMVLNKGKNMFNTVIQGTGYVFLQMPVVERDLVRINVSQNVPVKVDESLVMFRMGNVERVSRLTNGILGSMLNKEGVVDEYHGSGFVCVAPTLRASEVIQKDIGRGPNYE